ncbi:hypothetical protein [Flexivirga caeni]|uniref:ABC transporter permease n=1 Tax=Flexivirga caeni TaxID=2294115 RepID=A0A3M9MEA9_9MICO|nr:hypothetical protein [Flexivirga caeni]RNI23900.1 hypothetical protein EFY87_06435 [Flexivirga caeni]
MSSRPRPAGRRIGPARVALRTHRRQILAWTLPLLGLLVIVGPSYASTYPQLNQRTHLIDSLSGNVATRLLYGPLPRPGTIGQLLTWEMGTYLVIVSSVFTLLLGVRFGRGAEESGAAELLQACGHSAAARLRGALAAVTVVAVGLGVGVAAVLLAESGLVEELTVRGALSLGLVTTCTGLFFGLAGLLAGALADSTGLARVLGFVVLAISFVLRAVANVHGVVALRWVSPLGWIDVVSPYTRNRWWTGAVFLAACVSVGGLVWLAGQGREYGSAVLHERAVSDDRLRVRSVVALTWHLERGRWLAWTVGVVAIGAFFGGMSGNLVTLLEGDSNTARLMREMTGEHRLDAAFFSFAGVLIGLLVGCYAVLTVLASGTEEGDGLLEDLLACGVRRRESLSARAVLAALGSLTMLLAAGAVCSLVTLSQLHGGAAGRGFSYVAGQWPAVLALTGLGVLCVGARRSLGVLAWVPVAGSAVLVLMGSVLHAPRWLQASAVFAHVPDYADGSVPSTGVVALLGCGVVCLLIGVVWRGRRDLMPE